MELPEQDRQALIEAARRRGVTGSGGAAFGVMPSSGKRPEKLNVSRDVNMPAQMARGWVAGTLGLPGDIESLGRMGINLVKPGAVAEESFLPTSEFYQEYLPGGDERPAAKFASGLGALTGGMGSTTLVRGAGKGAKAVGKALGPKAAEMAEGYLQRSGLAPSVIKPKGGNWLSGTVEKSTEPLRSRGPTEADREWILQHAENQRELGQDPTRVLEGLEAIPRTEAINNWIDTKLNKYIKNEMGTPEDPVRGLAERGITHLQDPPPETVGGWTKLYRKEAGFPEEGLGQSPQARDWENITDRLIASQSAGKLRGALKEYEGAKTTSDIHGVVDRILIRERVEQLKDTFKNTSNKQLEDEFNVDYKITDKNRDKAIEDWARMEVEGYYRGNPEDILGPQANFRLGLTARDEADFGGKDLSWLEKVPSEQRVYGLISDDVSDYTPGFEHLIDELRNATNPNSDLPANLRLKPEDLKKVTVPQAVERVAKINEWRLAQVEKAKLEGMLSADVYKAYPEQSMRWVQLNRPGQFAAESEAMGHSVRGYEPPEGGGSPYYGHGGWDAIKEGRAKVYSLRDKRGEPHVTIETRLGRPWNERSGIFYQYPGLEDSWAAYSKEVHRVARETGVNRDPNYITGYPEWLKANAPDVFEKHAHIFAPPPDEITQIKGKGNRAPKDEYLPMIQDFVRSGNWSRVGDLQNTGLTKAGDKYLTKAEYDDYLLQQLTPPGQNYARGGLVTDTDAIAAKLKATGMDDQKAFMQALRMADARQEAHMAGGGLLKALKGAQASTKSHPTVFPPAAPLTEAEMRPIAQRVAGQMTGEFVRPNPKLSVNPAGKAKKTFEREKTLPVEVTQRIEQKPAPYINYEEMKDAYLAGVPGDPTRGGVAKLGSLSEVHEGAEELRRLGDVEFEKTESGPVQLFGGPRYGAYSERDFWGSNLGPARAIQNTVDELGALGPVYGQYIKMSPESTNFALHNLDALLAYLQPEKLSKSKLEILNREIRKGSPKYGKFPGFSGFENPIDVLLQSQLHSDLRKHIAETLMKPKLTSSLGLRQGSDVLFGISEPSLRNLETGVSGYSVGKMEPGKPLTPSLHPTYDYDIPGSFLGQSRYPTPYEIAFPTSTAYTRANLKPGAQEFNTLKMIGAREKIDQQYIDQIKMYEELMKEYTGKKKGGLVKKSGLSVLNKAII
jgi:hypothetical protein